jgi:hypothetical protein
MTAFGPEIGMSTTAGAPAEGAKVVAGYGREPGLALRDLRKIASIEAGSAHADGDRWGVIGITLVPGPVPDHSGERGATTGGWVAYGTLTRRAAGKHEQDASVGNRGDQAQPGGLDAGNRRRAS